MDEGLGDLKAALRADRDLIKSIRDTQSDHTKRLTRLETGQDKLHERLAAVEGTLTTVHDGIHVIRDLLTGKIEQENPEG